MKYLIFLAIFVPLRRLFRKIISWRSKICVCNFYCSSFQHFHPFILFFPMCAKKSAFWQTFSTGWSGATPAFIWILS